MTSEVPSPILQQISIALTSPPNSATIPKESPDSAREPIRVSSKSIPISILSEHPKPKDNDRTAESQPASKTHRVLIPSKRFVEVGKKWLVLHFALGWLQCGASLDTIANYRYMKIAIMIIQNLVAMAGIAEFAIVSPVVYKEEDGTSKVIACVIASLALAVAIAMRIIRLYATLREKPLGKWVHTILSIALFLVGFFGLWVALTLLDNSWNVYFYPTLIGIYIQMFMAITFTIMGVVGIPLFIGISVLEFLIRLLICKMQCPIDTQLNFELLYFEQSFSNEKHKDEKCVICLEHFSQDLPPCSLACKHPDMFHGKCLEEWIKRKGICPVCRQKAIKLEIPKDADI